MNKKNGRLIKEIKELKKELEYSNNSFRDEISKLQEAYHSLDYKRLQTIIKLKEENKQLKKELKKRPKYGNKELSIKELANAFNLESD